MLFLAVVLLGAGSPWALYWLGHQNTLHDGGRWRSSKTDCKKGVIGGAMAVLTRVMLHRDRLDLSCWFGFQEIYLAEPLVVERLTLRARLSANSHLSVMFDRGGQHFDHLAGFRLSRRSDLPSGFFTTGRKRLFETMEPMAAGLGDGWHAVELRFAASRVSLFVDGTMVGEAACEPPARRRIGVRGARQRVLVDDIEITHRLGDGRRATLRESFDRAELRWPALAVGVLVAGAAFALVFGLARTGRLRARRAAVVAGAVVTSLGLLGWMLLTLDRFWLSARYPTNPLQRPEYPNTMFRPEVPERPWGERHPGKAAAERLRVLLLGGSQTWGSGATTLADTWSRLLEASLNDLDPARGYECINLAASGADTTRLLGIYDRWRQGGGEADLVVLNVGFNDADGEAYVRNLVRFAEVVAAAGSRLVFVLEANCPEDPDERLAGNHVAMRIVAWHSGVPLIDLDGMLSRVNDEGFLWWDRVHATSAGQQRIAELLASPILAQLR